MTDNTNIEALRKEFEALPHSNSASFERYSEQGYYKNRDTENVFYGYMLGRRAALSNAEPVGYIGRIFVDQLTGERSVVLSNEAKTLPDMTRLFLNPSVQAPTVAWYSPATGGFYLSLDSVPPHIKVMGLQALGVIEELK